MKSIPSIADLGETLQQVGHAMSKDKRTPEQIDADDHAEYLRNKEREEAATRDGSLAYHCEEPLSANPYTERYGHLWDCAWITAHLEHLNLIKQGEV